MARRNDFVTAFRRMKSGGNPFDRAQAERKQAEERQKRLKEEAEKRKAEKEKREAEEREAKRRKAEERARLGAERKRKDEEMRRNSNALDSYETFGADPIGDRATQLRAAIKRRKELGLDEKQDNQDDVTFGKKAKDLGKVTASGAVDYVDGNVKASVINSQKQVNRSIKNIKDLEKGKVESDGLLDWWQDTTGKVNRKVQEAFGVDPNVHQEQERQLLEMRLGKTLEDAEGKTEQNAIDMYKSSPWAEGTNQANKFLLDDNIYNPETATSTKNKIIGNVAKNVGNQGARTATGLLMTGGMAPTVGGLTAMAPGVYGQSAMDTMENGFSYEQARNKALYDTALEVGTEKLMPAMPFDNATLSNILGEAAEEYTNERLGAFGDAFLGKDIGQIASENAIWKGDNAKNALTAAGYGALGTVVQGGIAHPVDTAQRVVNTTKNGANIVSNAINNTDNYQRNQEISALKVKYNELQENIATVAATDPQKAKAMKAELDNIREVLMQQANEYANPEIMSENSLNRKAADSALEDITQWTDDANAYQEQLRQEQLAQQQADYEQQVAEREAQFAQEHDRNESYKYVDAIQREMELQKQALEQQRQEQLEREHEQKAEDYKRMLDTYEQFDTDLIYNQQLNAQEAQKQREIEEENIRQQFIKKAQQDEAEARSKAHLEREAEQLNQHADSLKYDEEEFKKYANYDAFEQDNPFNLLKPKDKFVLGKDDTLGKNLTRQKLREGFDRKTTQRISNELKQQGINLSNEQLYTVLNKVDEARGHYQVHNESKNNNLSFDVANAIGDKRKAKRINRNANKTINDVVNNAINEELNKAFGEGYMTPHKPNVSNNDRAKFAREYTERQRNTAISNKVEKIITDLAEKGYELNDEQIDNVYNMVEKNDFKQIEGLEEKPDFDTSKKIELSKEQIDKFTTKSTHKSITPSGRVTKRGEKAYYDTLRHIREAINEGKADNGDYIQGIGYFGDEVTLPMIKSLQTSHDRAVTRTKFELELGTISLDEANKKLHELDHLQNSINNGLVGYYYEKNDRKLRDEITREYINSEEGKKNIQNNESWDAAKIAIASTEKRYNEKVKGTNMESYKAFKEDFLNKSNVNQSTEGQNDNDVFKDVYDQAMNEQPKQQHNGLDVHELKDNSEETEYNLSKELLELQADIEEENRLAKINKQKKVEKPKPEPKRNEEVKSKVPSDFLDKVGNATNIKAVGRVNEIKEAKVKEIKKTLETEKNIKVEPDSPEDHFVEKIVEQNAKAIETEDNIKEVLQDEEFVEALEEEMLEGYDDGYYDYYDEMYEDDAEPEVEDAEPEVEQPKKVKKQRKPKSDGIFDESKMTGADETREQIKKKQFNKEHTIETFKKLKTDPNMPKELQDFFDRAIKQRDKGFRAETLNLESLTRSSTEFIDRNGYENAKKFIDAVYKNTTTFDENLQHAIERTAVEGRSLFQTKESAIDGIYKGIDTRTQDLMNTMIGKASANAKLIKETYEKTLDEIESKGLIARNEDGNIRILDANGTDVTDKNANVAERLQNEYEGFNHFVNDILAYQTALSQTKSYAGQTLRLARRNHFASKEYQAKKMQEQVDQLNDQIKKSFVHKFKKPTKVKLNQELFDQYMKAENNIERAQIMEDIQMDLARQMPPTIRGWYDQTRYTAMLFHVPTHGRNLVGNALTGGMFNVKDGLRYAVEKHLEKSGKIAHDSYDNSNAEHNKINSAVEGMLYTTDLPGIDNDSPIMKQNNVARDYGEWLKLGGNKKAFFEKRGYDGTLLDDIVKSDATSSDEFTLMKNAKMNKYLSKRITSMMIDDGIKVQQKGIMPNDTKLVDQDGNDVDTTAYINKAYNSVENQVLSEEDLRTSDASRKEVKEFMPFASNIYEQKQAERAVTNDTKYRMKSGAQQYVNNWGNNWAVGRAMGKVSKFNSDMLNKADILFLKPRFEKTLSKSLAAQGYTIEGNKLYKNGKALTNEQQTDVVDRLSDKALQEAKEATFHDESVIANALNRLINDTGKAGVAISVVQPFVQTPVNVFRRGVEFSPIGLATSAAKFKTLAENGQTDKAINEVCKGLTGTGIALMGALLNSLGVLDIDLGDDEEKKEYKNAFSRMFGRKNISVKVLGHRIDISNIQPSVIPLAFGAWARKEIENGVDFEKIGEDPMTVVADAIGSMAQPFLYASFMTGITDIAKDMAQSDNSVGAILTTLASTAITQMLPQAGGAFNRVIDDKQRETYTTNATQNVINQAKRKIPFMSTDLEPKIDRYTGEELKNNGGDTFASRAAYNTFGIVPIIKELKDPELEEMMRLYGNSKSADVFPQQVDYRSKLTRDGIEYKLTPKERTKVNKVIGKTWRSATEGFVNSEMYKGMSDAERESVMKKIKTYSLQAGQDEYYKGLPVGSVMSKLNKNCTIAKNDYGLEPYQFFTYNDIEGVKDAETGKTIRNSESLLKLQQLEAYGLGDISATAMNQVFGISQSVLDMDEEELAVRMEYLDTDLTKKQVKEILETGTFTPSSKGGSGRKSRKGRKGRKGSGSGGSSSRSSSSKTTDPIALFRKVMNGSKSDNTFSRDVKNRSNFTLNDDLFAKTVFRPKSDKPLTASQLYGMKLKSDTQ